SIRLDLARPPPRSTLFPYTTLFRSRERRLDRNVGLRLRKAAEQIELERVGQPLLKSRRELIEFGLALARIAFGTDIDIVEIGRRSEEHTSELQSRENLVCRLLLEKK